MWSYASLKRMFHLMFLRRFSTKRDRATSLHECLDPSADCRKRRWRPWILLVFVITVLYVIYCYNTVQNGMESLPSEENIKTEEVVKKLFLNTKKTELQDKMNIENTERIQEVDMKVSRKQMEIKVAKEENLKDIAVFPNSKEPTTKAYKKIYCIPKNKKGKIVITHPSSNVSLDKLYPMVQKGGYYHPPDCSPKQRVGIIVPYRDRAESLRVFLYNMHPFLMNQQLEYRIFVVEQYGFKPFNKGCLFNAGFKEMLKFSNFDCLVLHDVDLVPMDDRILYSCPSLPRHMCGYISKKDLRANNITTGDSLFGGVTSLTVDQFKRANGYSNLYYGWGGEDNDMFFRLRASGYPVVRYNRSIAVYSMLPHVRAPVNPERYHLLATIIERYKTDGLSDITYTVVFTKLKPLYTHLLIDIDPTTTYKYT